MTLLAINNLGLSIHDSAILSDISFAVSAGEIVGVVGESGSGKSMTALSIMRLLPGGSELSGSVSLSDQNLLGLSESEMCDLRGRSVGMIFQEPMTALNPVIPIGQQVSETVQVHGGVDRQRARAIAADTLRRVDLAPEQVPLTRFPHELSGGQRQRVMIAMAIALHPKLLIADEPTTALDVTTQAQILALLKKLAEEDGMGMILISHDLAVVSNMADSILIMRQGKVVEQGPVRQVLGTMQHAYTRELFAASGHVPQQTDRTISDAPLLEVHNLGRSYRLARKKWFDKPRYLHAVNNVSFSLYRGESLGLVGESGCGKSTLTRAILGLDPVQQGHIVLDGQQVVSEQGVDPALRRMMQVVFQDPYGSFNPRHKVARLIAEPFHLLEHSIGRQRQLAAVHEVLDQVGLSALAADKYIHEFSGGQRQRIAIARALIIKPALIVLDEAVSALDVSIRAQILDLLAELAARHQLSYLFISHDLSVVRNVTDRVLVMRDGVIVEHGATHDVFDAPQHSYTRELINAVPKLADWGREP